MRLSKKSFLNICKKSGFTPSPEASLPDWQGSHYFQHFNVLELKEKVAKNIV